MPADSDAAPPTVLLNGAVLYESVLDAGATVFGSTPHGGQAAGLHRRGPVHGCVRANFTGLVLGCCFAKNFGENLLELIFQKNC